MAQAKPALQEHSAAQNQPHHAAAQKRPPSFEAQGKQKAAATTADSEMVFYTEIESPIGRLRLAGNADGLREIHFIEGWRPWPKKPEWMANDAPFGEVIAQLEEYFAGKRREFDLPLALQGTPFQLRVWHALLEIPYGETVSYKELAERIGNVKAVRAVGLANGANPIPIVVPCHRVIGSNGSLIGFGGGLPLKQKLLALEKGQLRLL
jgi:methylated-DNA-[protein]-cysteine S-methyltransferase